MKVKNDIRFSKQCLILAVALMATVSFAAIAVSDGSDAIDNSGTSGGVDWTLYGETVTLSPSDNPQQGYERGRMAQTSGYFWAAGLNNPAQYLLEIVNVNEGVLSICDSAFYNVNNGGSYGDVGLIVVNLPSSLESIGYQAFWGDLIEEITIPENVKSIGDQAFQYNHIKKVTVKAYVPPQMNSNALDGNRISVIYVPSESLDAYKNAPGWSKFANLMKPMDFENTSSDGAWTYKAGTLTLSKDSNLSWNEAFPNLPVDNVKNVVVGDGVTNIGKEAFKGLGSLKSVVIAAAEINIGEKAFKGCSSLTSVEIKGDVFIGSYAFSGTKLENFKVDGAITGQGRHIFEDVNTFKTIIISKGFASPEPSIFRHQVFLTSVDLGTSGVTTEITGMMFAECYGLKTIVIPYGVTKIDSYAFKDCANLETIAIPDSVKEIGVCAFLGCEKLSSVKIPSSVKTIDIKAFAYCKSLKTVVVGDGVETIKNEAFQYCTSLEQLTIGRNVKTIGEDIIFKCTNLKSLWFDCMINGNGFDKNAFEISAGKDKPSMPGLTIYYRTGSSTLDVPISDYKQGVCKYTYTWLDQNGKVLQENKDMDSIDLPAFNGETPNMNGLAFTGWYSYYDGMGNTVLTAMFTDGEIDDIGGDDGVDDKGHVGPIEKVKNWFKDKVKVVVNKLKGLFVFPKISINLRG